MSQSSYSSSSSNVGGGLSRALPVALPSSNTHASPSPAPPSSYAQARGELARKSAAVTSKLTQKYNNLLANHGPQETRTTETGTRPPKRPQGPPNIKRKPVSVAMRSVVDDTSRPGGPRGQDVEPTEQVQHPGQDLPAHQSSPVPPSASLFHLQTNVKHHLVGRAAASTSMLVMSKDSVFSSASASLSSPTDVFSGSGGIIAHSPPPAAAGVKK
eukprot:CAMPEP_0179001558 /NCGR_PEP_ID=MMETSP0795-20121207/11439_1 /TAXON_ID=88552 /ORGANISM="Amoebophrya sp., Strain Ameob2" /LENGTH=213 /DNA_ID=CAMNT_0020694969 /DNA_START=32 /DNA_END=670 /DNA_ORIENTATION=+